MDSKSRIIGPKKSERKIKIGPEIRSIHKSCISGVSFEKLEPLAIKIINAQPKAPPNAKKSPIRDDLSKFSSKEENIYTKPQKAIIKPKILNTVSFSLGKKK